MKISEALAECAHIERQIAGIYEAFAGLKGTAPDPALGQFWHDLAAEERGHALGLEEAARCSPAEHEIDLDAAKIAEMSETIRLRIPPHDPSLDEALAIALDLEDLEIDNIYRRLFGVTDDHRIRTALRTALAAVDHHEESLIREVRRRTRDAALVHRADERERRLMRSSSNRALVG